MGERSKTVRIPQDWSGDSRDSDIYIFFGPASVDWRGILAGLLYNVTRGRFYNRNSGTIVEAQAIGREIYDSLMILPATDLINAIREVAKAIQGGTVDYDDDYPRQVTYDPTDWATLFDSIDLAPVTNITNEVTPADVTIENNVDTQAVADSVDQFKTTFEARSVAETEAANTRADQVVAAIEAIKLSCNNTINCGGGCGGGEAETSSGEEGEPPPVGWSEPTLDGEPAPPGSPTYNLRKCKIANYLLDELIRAITKIEGMPYVAFTVEVLVTLFGSLWLSTIGVLILQYVNPATFTGSILAGVATMLDNLGAAVVQGGVNFTTMRQDLEDNREDFVCALYESTGSVDAIARMMIAADDVNMNAANQAVLSALLVGDYVGELFHDSEQRHHLVEAALDGYTPPTDCSACEDSVPPLFPFDTDLEGWYLVEYAPVYPALPNDNQSLVWQDHPYFPSTGEALASSADQESCYISSPIVNYYLDPGQSHTFEWKRKASNITYKLSLWMTDGSEVVLESFGVGNPDGIEQHNLDAHHGQTVRTIELSFGAGAGNRDFIIDYINITSA